MSRINQLRTDRPEALSNPEVFDIADQADKLQDLKVLYDTEGGKALVKLLMQDVVYGTKHLMASYRTATHTELIAVIAKLASDYDTAKLLMDAKVGMEILDAELTEALSE
jgi:hypothetical protein